LLAKEAELKAASGENDFLGYDKHSLMKEEDDIIQHFPPKYLVGEVHSDDEKEIVSVDTD